MPSAVEVIPGLWLGNIKAAINKKFIKEKKINCIINCCRYKVWSDDTIKVVNLDLSDTGSDKAIERMYAHLDPVVTFIMNQLLSKKIILVNCYAGKQRSPAIIMAFLIRYCGFNIQQTLDVLTKRWPHTGLNFTRSLVKFASNNIN